MARIPVRFERVAAAFNDSSSRVRLCESSGNEHSPAAESLIDLSDLVKSFIERDGRVVFYMDDDQVDRQQMEKDQREHSNWSDSDTKDMLQNLFGSNDDDDDDDDDDDSDPNVKQKIRAEVEFASGLIGDMSCTGFKRQLMACLRDSGFDAGLCKSKWEKTGRFPSGNYEYIDVNVNGNRYIVEVSLDRQFEIARPTDQYASLLNVFPRIFVGKVEELKKIVKLMCSAIKKSMKVVDLHVPPWRRKGYMQSKWFGNCKRTTNEIPSKNAQFGDAVAGKRSVGFEAKPSISYNCREDFASKVGLSVGHLTAMFNGNVNGMGLQL